MKLLNLPRILDRIEQIMKDLQKTDADRNKIKGDIHKALLELCGDFPGAVAVRHSYMRFRAMDILDE